MENLDTYNRVKSLESPLFKKSLWCCNVLLVLIVPGSLTTLWLMGSTQAYSLGTIAIAVPVYILFSLFNHLRVRSCQFCGHGLGYVIRPFLLTPKYLALQGHKKGNYFYTRCFWGNKPLLKRWARISNRSLTCHHCRLTEEKHSKHYEVVSAGELTKLQIMS